MLHYEIIGTGYPILFLHGFLESTAMWKPLSLDQKPFRAILVDLPGHGKSPLNATSPELQQYALQVQEILETEGITEFGIVGHSMGGYIALEMAKLNSDIEKIVLLNSCFWQDSEQKQSERKRVLQILERNKERYIQEAIPSMFVNPKANSEFISETIEIAKEMSLEAIQTATQAMLERTSSEGIADCLGKNLKIIQSEFDLSVPLKLMIEKTEKKAFDISVLKGVGHMSYVENPEDVNTLILDFFKADL